VRWIILLLSLFIYLPSKAQSIDDYPEDLIQQVNSPIGELTVKLKRRSFRSQYFEVLVHKNGNYESITPGEHRSYIGTIEGRKDGFAVGYKSFDGSVKTVLFLGRGVTWYFLDGNLTRTYGQLDYADVEYIWPHSMTMTSSLTTDTTEVFGMGYDVATNAFENIYNESVDEVFEAVEFTNLLLAATYIQNALLEPSITRVIIRTDNTSPYYNLTNNRLAEVSDHWISEQSDAMAYTYKVSYGMHEHPVGGVAWSPGTFSVNTINDERVFNTFYVVTRHEMGHNWWMDDYDGGYYEPSLNRTLSPEGKTIMNGNRYARFSGPETHDIFMYRQRDLNGTRDFHLQGGLDYSLESNIYSFTDLPPYASLDLETIIEGYSYYIDVLGNDFDANGHQLSLLDFDNFTKEGGKIEISDSVSLEGKPLLIYTPPGSFNETFDQFFYTIIDESGFTNEGTVLINVLNNDEPWTFTHVDIDNAYMARSRSNEFDTDHTRMKFYEDDSWAEWNIQVPNAGSFEFSLTYSSTASTTQNLSLQINDGDEFFIDIISTQQEKNYTNSETIKVDLKKGFNKLKFSGNSSNIGGKLSIKNFTISPDIIINEPNKAPYFIDEIIQSEFATVELPYGKNEYLTLYSNDPNPGDILSYEKLSGPSWLSIELDGSLTGTPSKNDKGLSKFEVIVQDQLGLSDTTYLHIEVIEILKSTIYEAEDANYEKVTFKNNNSGFSGSGYLDFDSGVSGGFIEWNVFSSEKSKVYISFVYANNSTDRPLNVLLNDLIKANSFSFPNTGSWNNYYSTSKIELELIKGQNKIRVEDSGSNGSNIDYLFVEFLDLVDEVYFGDVDDDGDVDSFDAASVLNYSVGTNLLSAIDPEDWESDRFAKADVDGDGLILAVDATRIFKYVVGAIDSLQVQSNTGNSIDVEWKDGKLYFSSTDQLDGFNLIIPNNEKYDIASVDLDWETGITALNTTSDYELGIASTKSVDGTFLQVPLVRTSEDSETVELVMYANNKKIVKLVELPGAVTSKSDDELPKKIILEQNYPNPFNPSTQIQYALPEAMYVTLEIYNSVGQMVTQIVNTQQSAGYYTASFDASGLSSGVYLYKLTTPLFIQTKKMLLIK
jgi:hypothetical protein